MSQYNCSENIAVFNHYHHVFSIILYAAIYIADIRTVLRELSPIAVKWDDLGLALDLSPDTLEVIRKDHYGYNARLSATVSAWLRGEEEREVGCFCVVL